MDENKYEGLSFFENNEFGSLDNEFLKGSMDNIKNEEKGLLQKAIGFSKKGAENIQKGFKVTLEKTNLINTPSMTSNSTAAETGSVFSNFPLFNSQSRNNESNSFFGFTTLLSYKNFPLFCVLFGVSILFMILSFLTLPMIVIAPRQFGFFFTLSSFSFITSLAFLKGFSSLYFHLLEKNRIPFTATYILSLVSTLYFTVIKPLYLLALITSVVQVLALISFIVSYIPGGSEAIKMLISAMYSYIKKLFTKSNSSDLPF